MDNKEGRAFSGPDRFLTIEHEDEKQSDNHKRDKT